jgi:hypothetical protein
MLTKISGQSSDCDGRFIQPGAHVGGGSNNELSTLCPIRRLPAPPLLAAFLNPSNTRVADLPCQSTTMADLRLTCAPYDIRSSRSRYNRLHRSNRTRRKHRVNHSTHITVRSYHYLKSDSKDL